MSNKSWITGSVSTPAGEIPGVATRWTILDLLGHLRVRLGVLRNRYSITPGLYAVGNPDSRSPIFVTANYKLSFDHLRRELNGRDGWIMVLDTRSINVWCAASEGTFGTDEVVTRIEATRLSEIVTHRRLILPQLGAPGVRSHEVKDRTGFRVKYGPVRAVDLPEYLDKGRQATQEMRRVNFGLGDRLVLIPQYLLSTGLIGLIAAGVLVVVFRSKSMFSLDLSDWVIGAVPVFGGTFCGAVFVPMLLPWLPGRSFSAKGAWTGVFCLLVLGGFMLWQPELAPGWLDGLAWLLLVPALASFVGMNFTGSSNYTSLSGVRKEITMAVRFQAAATILGLGFWIAARYV